MYITCMLTATHQCLASSLEACLPELRKIHKAIILAAHNNVTIPEGGHFP